MACLAVIAKEPRPGFAKTRLVPPCSPEQAAAIASAALRRTLEVVAAVPHVVRVLALDGQEGDWIVPGFTVVAQRQGGLGERLAGVVADCFALDKGPVVVVGMDTPQLATTDLTEAIGSLRRPRDAVLAPAIDGGYWLIGLAREDAAVFDEVPMSTDTTAAAQLDQLQLRGFVVAGGRRLRDVDRFDDAVIVAAELPNTPFAAAVNSVRSSRSAAPGADRAPR